MTKRQAAHLAVLLKPTVTARNERSGLPDCTEEQIAKRVEIIASTERLMKAVSQYRRSIGVWSVNGFDWRNETRQKGD